MSYIIIQMESDPLDIETISILPEEDELKVKQFKKEEDAVRFLYKHGIEDDTDTKIVRLH
mgnify:CR=1 FL=1|jgi:hypothetical protein